MLAPFEHALAEIHAEGVSQHGDRWMSRVQASLDALVQSYQQLTNADRQVIDYSTIETQAAYLYAYAMPRAYFTREMLCRHRQANGGPLLPTGKIEVVSFGGGPASELIGLLDYLGDAMHGEAVTAITYRVFDKDADWIPVAEKVCAAANTALDVSMEYERLDLADTQACAGLGLDSADLIVFSYIMSELCALSVKDAIAQNLRTMLGPIKGGSAMLFVDSKHPSFIQYFQACRKFIGIQKNDDGEGVNLARPAFLPTFQTYQNALDRNPRMDATIISKWFVKA